MMQRNDNQMKFLGVVGYLIQEYGPRVKAAHNNFYHDPETYFKLLEEFRARYQQAEQSFLI